MFSKTSIIQKQPSRGVLRKRCPENMQEIYTMEKFWKVTLCQECSSVNLLQNFRPTFPKNTSRELLLIIGDWYSLKYASAMCFYCKVALMIKIFETQGLTIFYEKEAYISSFILLLIDVKRLKFCKCLCSLLFFLSACVWTLEL